MNMMEHYNFLQARQAWGDKPRAALEQPTGKESLTVPPEAQTEAEKIAYCAGWWAAMEAKEKEQPEQEPVAMLWKVRKALALASAICDRVPNRWHHTHEIGSAEADIGDMVNAHPDGTHGYRLIQEAEAELVAYLTTPEAAPQRQSEPEQEPVAWIQSNHLQKAQREPFLCRVEPTQRLPDFVPIYTNPPRREWQGLTEEEIWKLYYDERVPEGERCDRVDFARAIEAALKEKNK